MTFHHVQDNHDLTDNTDSADLTTQSTSTIQEPVQDLMARQLELEKEMADRGRSRYFRQTNKLEEAGKASQTSYSTQLLKRGIEAVALELEAHKAYYQKGGAGRKTLLYYLMKDIDTKVVAFIALRKFLDTLTHDDCKLTYAAQLIGRALEFELKMDTLKKEDKERYDATLQHLKGNTHAHHRQRVFTYAFGKTESVIFKPFKESEAVQVGFALLDIIRETLGLFEEKRIKNNNSKHLTYIMTPTSTLLDWIERHKETAALLRPDYLPTLIQPKPWTSVYEGGYYSHDLPILHLMKTHDKEHLNALQERIEQGKMNEVLKSLNALQDTAWKVNTQVLEVVKHLWDNTPCDMAGLPPKEKYRLPLCPLCGQDLTDNTDKDHACFHTMSEEEVKEWKTQARRIHCLNASLFSKHMVIVKTLSLADRFAHEDALYFPYQMDFRGRLYTIPVYLTPQGTGLAKGLLKFSKALPLGNDEAVKWLAIHGANTYGNDKISFEDRVQWVKDNQDKILACTSDPYSYKWWHDADEPFCFLAFCFEWSGYVEQGLAFESSLPIAMDGTCNGLQLYSLLLKDEIGGLAVNLIPTDAPQDIYGIVAEKVKDRVKEDAKRSPSHSMVYTKKDPDKEFYNTALCGKFFSKMDINRKTTKRQVMVLPYGGTFESCKSYSKEWIESALSSAQLTMPKGYNALKLSYYLAKHVWDSIENTVTKAPEGMKFLQHTASRVNKENKPLIWETPSGLLVKQGYKSTKERRVRTHLGDSIVCMSLQEDIPNTVNKTKQKNSIAPNYIHSLDASALMHTVNLAHDKGIDAFAMIHDSYGTHAAKSACLAQTLRQGFVEMFNGDVNLLTKWQEDVIKNLGDDVSIDREDLPDLPSLGTLDINQLMKSQFFFA